MKRLIPLACLALAVTACGAAKRVAPPPNPPEPVTPGGPPPTWVETQAGARWLGFSTYCWTHACADGGVACPDKRHLPMLTLFQHETVRFHLGFEPKAVSLTTALRDFKRPRREVLVTTRDPSWEVKPAEVLVLSATSRAGHASYAACLRIDAKL